MKPVLAGKRTVVYGLGKSGVAAARLLVRERASVIGLDRRTDLAEAQELRQLGVSLILGQVPNDLLRSADLVVVSPGVPLALPEIEAAKSAGTAVWGEVELASRFIEESLRVGITGTNGKSTTTALTGEMFAQSGRRVFVGGNLGRPLSESPLEKEPYPVHVIELSSFQLEAIEQLRLDAAALLNITPDHLDRYPDFQSYAAAKARIFANQRSGDVAIVNLDDREAAGVAATLKVPVYGFSLHPTSSGLNFLAGTASAREEGFQLWRGETYSVNNRALRGPHNLQNAMAAALVARLCGVERENIQRALDRFPGLPHRLEWVRTLDRVEWINDSKATNVDSTLVALNALDGPIWLIAGGRGKGASYRPILDAGEGKLRGVLTIGEDAARIEAELGGRFAIYRCADLQAAVGQARGLARSGDTVLLSPACASYDQFRNFEHRGEAFKSLVGALQ